MRPSKKRIRKAYDPEIHRYCWGVWFVRLWDSVLSHAEYHESKNLFTAYREAKRKLDHHVTMHKINKPGHYEFWEKFWKENPV